jgi:hypothetical protein
MHSLGVESFAGKLQQLAAATVISALIFLLAADDARQ